ncbi:unnamed protein product [Phytophthora fragariaefolia]|uniref:Unnamed protein product n=1 Tax=Phytophthora fragariaefolia TaxID=1490495 RepID=A0A9W7CY35_9STRA|nr:unnamed protein product [Phytophthora fragariaefolia]
MVCVAVVQDQDQVAQVKAKLLKPKLWKTEITDHALTTNAACSVLRLTSNRCCAVCCQASMVRAKRKGTRETIEEALRQNAHVNATPAELEETTDKRKRQRRRANKKRNLLKELEALSVAGTEVAGPLAVLVMHVQPILPAQPTLEREGKQEEDDPADHQRQFAAAYAEGQRQFVSEASPPVTTNPPSADRGAAKRARNTERQRIRRANMTLSQKERERRTEDERGAVRATDRAHHSERRAQHTEDQQDAQREHNRVRRKAPKRCQGHVNHEDFRASMVTGKAVVDGRHRLPPTIVCPLCQAWKWPAESEFICCLKGWVQLPPLQPAPPSLIQLYGDKEFRRHIRAYNQAFAFTSIGVSSSDSTFRDVNQDQSVVGQHGVYTYRIQRTMGHFMGSMLPYVDRRTGERVPPKFVQIYIVDPDMQERANRRKGIFADLDIVALQDIENMMVECNPFAQQFLSFGQKLREDFARGMQVKDILYVLHSKPSEPRTYNLPTVSEVGVALVEDGIFTRPRNLYVVAKDHSLLRLFETDEKYDPLQYPLLFPYGDLGWTYTDTALHQGGRLFQQWVVDQRAKCEQEQLRWVAKNLKKLRAELYHGISDALLNEETVTLGEGEVWVSVYDRATGTLVHPGRGSRYEDFLNQVGKRIASRRTLRESSEHVQTLSGVHGYRAGTAQDRREIVARVWQLKLKAKLADLDEGLLGRLEARIYVVEFQKRGSPHAHIVIIVADEDKPRTREIIDKLVSAEVPDKEINPDLYETVMTCMMHGPCGPVNPDSPCMKDGKCTKGFPKPLLEVTQANLDGFPLYRRRRREPGVLIFKDRQYDNETVNLWVVPYNAYLCQKYDWYINVEVCTTIGAIKYLYKYV